MNRCAPALLLPLLACGAARSAAPTVARSIAPSPRVAVVATTAAPPVTPARAPDAADGAARLQRALEASARVFWALRDPDGAAACRELRTARFNPRDTLYGRIEPLARDGAEMSVQYHVDASGRTVLLDAPRLTSLRGRFAQGALPDCAERCRVTDGGDDRIETDRGTWYLARAACERDLAAGTAHAVELGVCSERLARVLALAQPGAARTGPAPATDDEPLHEVAERGGRVFELASTSDDEPACVAWQLRPRRGNPGTGVMVSSSQHGRERWTTRYDYEYGGLTLTLLGPQTETFVDGRSRGSTSFGCGEQLVVMPEEGFVQVGAARWYRSAGACERARAELHARPRQQWAATGVGHNGC